MKTLVSILALCMSAPLAADGLGLEPYLAQVRSGNPALQSQRAQDAAYALAAKEPLTAFSPQLTAELQRYDDQAEPTVNLFSPQRTLAWGGSIGVSKLFSTGTYVGLDYNNDQSDVEFPLGGPIQTQINTGHKVNLTLSQPLWRNFMAAEVKAGLGQAEAGADAARAGNRYGAQALLFQARQAYVQLATLRQVEAIQAESLARNQKILEWTQRKYADNLADKVDVLQVEAALRQVALALAQTRDQQAKARLLFNQLRGVPGDTAVGDLEPLQAPAELPAPSGQRQDLQAAQAALRGNDALVQSVTQRFTPDVSLFAQLGMNERDSDGAQAFGDLWSLHHPTTVVGLKLTANLDLPLYRQVLAGAEKARGAGEKQVQAKQDQISLEWGQLKAAWDGVQSQLSLARELEGLQSEKADREKTRYRDGRTTNFQVLRFEDDYNLSRIQTLQLTAQAVVLAAQARFYNGDDQPW